MTITAGAEPKTNMVSLYRQAGQHALSIETLTPLEAEQLIKDLRAAVNKAQKRGPAKFGEH